MEKYILEVIKTLSRFRGSEEIKNRVIIEDYFLSDSGKRGVLLQFSHFTNSAFPVPHSALFFNSALLRG